MDPQQTAASYDKIGHHWAGSDFDTRDGIAQHQRAMQFLSASGIGRAMDVGCGSSGRIIDLLLSAGFEVEGLDISTTMVNFARAKHPTVTFHQADICTWDFTRTYDFISAWDSIWHVPLERHATVLKKLCDALEPGGVLIFTTGGVDSPNDVTNPDCHGQPLYHAALGIPQLLALIDEFGCVCRHLEYDQYPDLHLYLIVQKSGTPLPNPSARLSAGS